MTKDTINRHAGLTKMQQDLNALVVKVEGQRICVNRRVYVMAVVYGYSGKRLGLHDSTYYWNQY